MKKVLSFICDLPKKAVDTINTNRSSFILITVCSFLLNIILEAALRKSFIKAFALIYKAPVPFFFNVAPEKSLVHSFSAVARCAGFDIMLSTTLPAAERPFSSICENGATQLPGR